LLIPNRYLFFFVKIRCIMVEKLLWRFA
jgi:hypothetical protein